MTENRITPPNRNRRLMWIVGLGTLLAAALYLIFQALGENTQFFENPSEVVAEGFVAKSQTFKVGGLVAEGTLQTEGLTSRFLIEDFERDMRVPLAVIYTGKLPDLFKEGQGAVITGQLVGESSFRATEVLAKHDENYQPKINYTD